MNKTLQKQDSQIAELLQKDLERQQNWLTLIPSENYASKAVLQAQSSIFTNKYAEGYPDRRYYNGCQFVDEVETIAIDRAKNLFGAEHVNVQPHAGTQANMAAYHALLEPGDTILSMKLAHGGHLSHGLPQNFSGRYYNIIHYGVEPDSELIDLGEVSKLALKHRPKAIVVGASAYSRIIEFSLWREIADEVGAYLIADIAHIAGLIAGKVHPDAVAHSDVVTTTTHKTLRGPRGAIVMCKEKFSSSIDRAVFPGLQGGPFMHAIAAKAVAFKEALEPEFREYQRQVVKNAKVLADRMAENGFRIVSGGTDNHLMLVDLTSVAEKLSGRQAANYLDEAGITVNKNGIPFDKRSAKTTSGIRIGTPMVTVRGMREEQMVEIADLISLVLRERKNPEVSKKVRNRVIELCEKFPIYEALDLWA